MTQIEKDEMIREALQGAGEILKLAYEACGLKVGITGELAYPNGKFLLRFYPFDESFSNSENKTTLGQASSEPIADNKQLGNGTQAVVTDEASENILNIFHMNYYTFKLQLSQILETREGFDEEWYQDWYIEFRESVYSDVKNFAEFWFADQSPDDYYWLREKFENV